MLPACNPCLTRPARRIDRRRPFECVTLPAGGVNGNELKDKMTLKATATRVYKGTDADWPKLCLA